jgi:hypothetical protein
VNHVKADDVYESHTAPALPVQEYTWELGMIFKQGLHTTRIIHVSIHGPRLNRNSSWIFLEKKKFILVNLNKT